ncbi:hypothetical protein FB45DRAFT_894117 [Roridomyces roridus]|uniref:Uncharacterized protein n=1 Tax=Roridomyces roridus TaxID=1738132 RepID=A0AAD7CFU5_9AGAR|nr:hypothetical protein FB45DRAFT_894117 [Roridomyces roridus]
MKEWGPRIVKSGGEHALAGADYFFHRVEHILFEAHTTLWLIFGDKELLYILTRAFLRFVQLLSDGYWDGEPDSEEIRVTLNEAIQEQLKTLLLLREEAMREAELDYEANDDLDAAAENIAIAEIVEFLMFCINGRPKVQRLALLGFLHSDILLETLKRQYKGDQMEDKAEYPGVPPNLIAPYSWHKDMLRGAKRELSVPWARIKDVVPLTTEPVGYFSLDFDDNIPLQNILRTFHGWKQGRSGAKRTPWESIAVDERTIMWIPSILSLLVDLVDKNPEEQQKLLRRWSELIPDDIDAHDDPFQLLEAVTLPLKRTLEPDEIASFDHDWDSLRFHLIPMQLFPKSTSALLKRLAVPQSCSRFEMPLRAMEVQWRRSQFRTKSSASFLQWFAANNVRLCPGIVPSEGAKIGQLLLEEGSLPGTVHYPWQSTRRHRPSATEMLAQMTLPAWSGDTAKERLEDVLSYALSDGGSTELGPWLQEFLKKCRPDNVSSFRCTADNIWYLGDSGDQLPTSASTIRVLCRKFVGELGIQYGNTQLGESLDVAWYFRRSEYLQSLQRLVQLVAPCANLRTTIINTEKATLSQYSDILNQRRPINDNDLMTMLAFGFNTWASRTQGVFSSFRNQLPTSGSAAALCFLFVVDAMEMERGHQLTPSLKVHHRAFFAWLGRLEGCTIHADWLPFPQQQSQDPRFYKSRLIHIAYLLLAAAVCYDRRIMRFVTEETLKDEQAFRSIRPRLKDYLVLLIWVTHGTVVGQIDQTRLQKLGPGLKTTLSFLRLAASGTDILCELQAFVCSLWAAEPYIPPPAGASANHFFQCLSDAHAILIKDQRFSQPPPEPLSWQQPLSIPSISTQTLGFASPMFERVASELDQGKPVNAVEQAFARMLSFQLPTGAASVHVRELLDGYLEQWVNDAFCGDTDSTDQNTPTDQNPGPANPGTEDEWVRRLSEVGVSTVEADGNEVIINRHTDTERKYPYTYTKRVTAKALLLGEPASGSLTARRTFDSVWRRVLRVRCDGIEDASIVQISKKEWKVHRDTVG